VSRKREGKADFELNGGSLQGEIVNCIWFEKRKETRNEYPEEESCCPSICGRHTHTCSK